MTIDLKLKTLLHQFSAMMPELLGSGSKLGLDRFSRVSRLRMHGMGDFTTSARAMIRQRNPPLMFRLTEKHGDESRTQKGSCIQGSMSLRSHASSFTRSEPTANLHAPARKRCLSRTSLPHFRADWRKPRAPSRRGRNRRNLDQSRFCQVLGFYSESNEALIFL